MSDGEFSYEHPFINYGHTNGAILMKPNTPKISKLSLHLVKIDEGTNFKSVFQIFF